MYLILISLTALIVFMIAGSYENNNLLAQFPRHQPNVKVIGRFREMFTRVIVFWRR